MTSSRGEPDTSTGTKGQDAPLSRIAIPLYYALPIWILLLVVGMVSMFRDPNAVSVKHGGLTFASLLFGAMSLIPLALFWGAPVENRIRTERPANAKRVSAVWGSVGAAVLVALYVAGRFVPHPSAVVLVAMLVLPLVLIAGPFILRMRLTRPRTKQDIE